MFNAYAELVHLDYFNQRLYIFPALVHLNKKMQSISVKQFVDNIIQNT